MSLQPAQCFARASPCLLPMASQILALQEKASPEIFRRYPDTQLIGYSPASNTINVIIYTKTPDEAERKRIEAELTELVGHPVKVEFISGRITTM